MSIALLVILCMGVGKVPNPPAQNTLYVDTDFYCLGGGTCVDAGTFVVYPGGAYTVPQLNPPIPKELR